jgi:hypothetical protein
VNNAITNSDYASTMTLLPLANLNVQVLTGCSSPSVPATGFPGMVLTDVPCAPSFVDTGAPMLAPDAAHAFSSAGTDPPAPGPLQAVPSSISGPQLGPVAPTVQNSMPREPPPPVHVVFANGAPRQPTVGPIFDT